MHLASAPLCLLVGDCLASNVPEAVLAQDAVRALDAADVAKGVILSCAYLYGLRSLPVRPEDIAALVRQENEFTAEQVARYPGRLIGFFSVDPLQDSAIDEINHWRASPLLVGMKLHFAASGVHVRNIGHRRRLSRIFAVVAAQNLPMVIHIGGGKFDAHDAELFIREILPKAGNSWVQIAHAGGGEPSIGRNNLGVLRTFADHIARHDPATEHVLFDLAYVPMPEYTDDESAAITKQMRRIGLDRFLFGSDFNVLSPADEIHRLSKLSLTLHEWEMLRSNCAPWAC
jgi:uncharacterized protein